MIDPSKRDAWLKSRGWSQNKSGMWSSSDIQGFFQVEAATLIEATKLITDGIEILTMIDPAVVDHCIHAAKESMKAKPLSLVKPPGGSK